MFGKINKGLLLGGIVIIILIVGAVGYFLKQAQTPQVVHFHAGFQVYNNNKLVNFAQFQYMDFEPCTLNGKPVAQKNPNDPKERAHLHDMVGDVVHVHRSGATWTDLFKNIKYNAIFQNPVIGYINGKKVADALDQPIKPYDSAVFFIGKNDTISDKLKHAVTKSHIQQIEKKSELCSS